ncbi:hypothetical protein J1N35_043834 [Gossypium stocksii]|uniref:Uncharacterized protein n=1 Tax=Gossypium stocksii TaxID=47602 RepID=A0A9D3U8B7_9ROSI|nr:hypothetical protein J1N35_043834 [Gossypium stocksii]
MDFEGKQSCEELPISPKHENIQGVVVEVSLPTSGSDNPELGIEALTRLVKEVPEEVFKAKIKANGGTVQARSVECGKKIDRSPLKREPCSMKHVKTRLVAHVVNESVYSYSVDSNRCRGRKFGCNGDAMYVN